VAARPAISQLGVLADLTGQPVRDGPAPPGWRRQRDGGQPGQLQAALVVAAGPLCVRLGTLRVPEVDLIAVADELGQLAQFANDAQLPGYGCCSCRDR
jgi:hypothetical protein